MKTRKKINKALPSIGFIPISVIVLVLILVIISYTFSQIMLNYRENTYAESAEHLIELNRQMKLYVEEKISNDRKTVHSIGSSIALSNFYDNDSALFKIMERERDVWNVTQVMLYTENGFGISSDGSIKPNDITSDLIDKATKLGEYMTIVDSSIIYTSPITTELIYNGSKIVAVSVVQSMKTFLDDMKLSSFEGKAWAYLTEENGIVISRLSNDNSTPTYNFMSLTEKKKITPIGNGITSNILSVPVSTVFLMSDASDEDYIVSTPITTGNSSLRLFYLAPVNVVNDTMNEFSEQLLSRSLLIIFIFAVLALLMFIQIFKNSKLKFNKAIIARDRMFDLLVKNTKTAFGLFSINKKDPTYVSANAISIIGDKYIAIEKKDGCFQVRSHSNSNPNAISAINEAMKDWDGKSEYKSGYLLNENTPAKNYFELQLFPVEGSEVDFVGIARDVTKAFEREEAAKQALEMAERASSAKSQFLSNMSHDIRTPMNAIVNMTEFASDNIYQPELLSDYLNTIRTSSQHLLRIINDVLDMSRIESGQAEITVEPFDLIGEINRQADIIRPLCIEKNIRLIIEYDSIKTSSVMGDVTKLSQIIANLLSNAVKFTRINGTIHFTTEELPSLRDNVANYRFTIQDNGIGISKKYLKHIFEPFSREDNNRVGKIEGTGLGLSICHSYVAAMGGTISCESYEGFGSTFIVELFFHAERSIEKTKRACECSKITFTERPFSGMRCIVAEDNEINQAIAKKMLEKLGFIVDITPNGKECVQLLEKSTPKSYDLVYIDIQMPVMNGFVATSEIRKSNHPDGKTIPIVAMTANVFADDIEKARASGMNGFLGKPIMLQKLIEETKRVTQQRQQEA